MGNKPSSTFFPAALASHRFAFHRFAILLLRLAAPAF